jgi:hypothetical protein
MIKNRLILLFFAIFIIQVYAYNNECHNNEEEIIKEKIKANIQIINNLNIPLLLKLWVITGILVNYMQTIIYAIHIYHQ